MTTLTNTHKVLYPCLTVLALVDNDSAYVGSPDPYVRTQNMYKIQTEILRVIIGSQAYRKKTKGLNSNICWINKQKQKKMPVQ